MFERVLNIPLAQGAGLRRYLFDFFFGYSPRHTRFSVPFDCVFLVECVVLYISIYIHKNSENWQMFPVKVGYIIKISGETSVVELLFVLHFATLSTTSMRA